MNQAPTTACRRTCVRGLTAAARLAPPDAAARRPWRARARRWPACSIAGAPEAGGSAAQAAREAIAKFWAEHEEDRPARLRQLAALHRRQRQEQERPPDASTSSPSRPASRSSTARSSSRTTPTSARSSPSSPSGPGHRLRPHGHHQRALPRQADRARLPGPARPERDGELLRLRQRPGEGPELRPRQRLHDAWQSGITGIGYNPKKLSAARSPAGRTCRTRSSRARSACSATPRTCPNSALLAVGVAPETSTAGRLAEGRGLAEEAAAAGAQVLRAGLHRPAVQGRHLGHRWRGPATSSRPTPPARTWSSSCPKEGALIWTDNMCIPLHAQHPRDAMTYMDCVYQPEVGADRRVRQLHHPGRRPPRRSSRRRPSRPPATTARRTRGPRDQPADLPERWPTSPSCTATACSPRPRRRSGTASSSRSTSHDGDRARIRRRGRAGRRQGGRLRAKLAPYWLVLPGWLWLVIFFVVPTLVMLSVSTMTGDIDNGLQADLPLHTYSDAWSHYHSAVHAVAGLRADRHGALHLSSPTRSRTGSRSAAGRTSPACCSCCCCRSSSRS